MLEIPEALTVARQLKETLLGKTITKAVAAASPHGFAFYFGDPAIYGDLLEGKKITGTAAYGGRPEIEADDMRLSFGEGVNMRYADDAAKAPAKHQLWIEFDDGSIIFCTIQMYGFIGAFPEGGNDDYYYMVGKEKPSPLTDKFDFEYFSGLLTDETRKISAKAFLATEQRIPGLGNGVLQDILWYAKIHPKRKMATLSDGEFKNLFDTVKTVLAQMTEKGGRDTEKDIFGNPGGFETVMSKKNDGMPCPVCGDTIRRFSYLGGNVYVCEGCQGTGK